MNTGGVVFYDGIFTMLQELWRTPKQNDGDAVLFTGSTAVILVVLMIVADTARTAGVIALQYMSVCCTRTWQ